MNFQGYLIGKDLFEVIEYFKEEFKKLNRESFLIVPDYDTIREFKLKEYNLYFVSMYINRLTGKENFTEDKSFISTEEVGIEIDVKDKILTEWDRMKG